MSESFFAQFFCDDNCIGRDLFQIKSYIGTDLLFLELHTTRALH